MRTAITAVGLRRFVTACLMMLTSVGSFAGQAMATNANLSSWTQNLSERTVDERTGFRDFNPEVEANGSTIHVIWITQDTSASVYTIYYKRSTDGGKTWKPKQAIFSDSDIITSSEYKRMTVVGKTVHIAVSHYEQGQGSWYGVLTYLRSTDNGLSFEPPRTLFRAAGAWHVYDTFVSGSNGKVSIGFRNQCNWKVDNSYLILDSNDGGATFSKKTAYRTSTGSSWRVWDLKRYRDSIYALYSDSYYYNGMVYSKLYIASSSDNGETFTRKLISVASKDGKHKTHPLQDYHYVPKIGASGANVYVTWSGLDREDRLRVFLRSSADNGKVFSAPVVLSKTLPSDANPVPGLETIAAQGNYVYAVFVSNKQQVCLRRSTDKGVTFKAMQTLTSPSGTYWLDKGWWPLVRTKPTDSTGSQVYVLWNWPTYVSSSNGGQTFTKPVLLSNHFTSGAMERPQMAVGGDGAVHWVAEGKFYSSGVYGDYDIFYRRHAQAPAPQVKNLALSTKSDGIQGRYDAMQVRATPSTSFTSKMTLELWVKPLAGGVTTGTSSYDKPIVHKRETYHAFSGYALGTTAASEGRNPLACINTASGSYCLSPGYYDSKYLVSDKVWTHLAMTYDANAAGDNFKLYKNGNLVLSTRATGDIISGDGLLMVGYYGNWTVDELRLWKAARTQQQIKNNMNKAVQPNATGLSAYYPFNGTTRDVTGRGNDGVLMYKEAFVAGKAFP